MNIVKFVTGQYENFFDIDDAVLATVDSNKKIQFTDAIGTTLFVSVISDNPSDILIGYVEISPNVFANVKAYHSAQIDTATNEITLVDDHDGNHNRHISDQGVVEKIKAILNSELVKPNYVSQDDFTYLSQYVDNLEKRLEYLASKLPD